MKPYLNAASPYARLVRVLLAETGREAELVTVDPWALPADLLAANPTGKVPALVLDDGTALVESGCIAAYLSGGEPKEPETLRRLGLARAAIDCAFGAVIQHRFAPGSALIERWISALPRIARYLDDVTAEDPGLAALTAAVAFEYVDFRLPEVPWRDAAPGLAGAVDILGGRESLRATRPS